MAKEKLTIVVPNEDDFKPAPIPFGVITGEGVDNYNEDGKEYSVSIVLNKKQKKDVLNTCMDFWEENKPVGAGAKPANYDGIIREGKDDNEGMFVMYAKTQTEFEGKHNNIGIIGVDADGVVQKLDPEEFGLIGVGSEGRLAVTLSTYTQGKKKGLSVFLAGVKLTKYVEYAPSGGVSAFGNTDKGDVSDAGEFSKKKSKKKKAESEPDEDEVEVPKKKKKKKKKHLND